MKLRSTFTSSSAEHVAAESEKTKRAKPVLKLKRNQKSNPRQPDVIWMVHCLDRETLRINSVGYTHAMQEAAENEAEQFRQSDPDSRYWVQPTINRRSARYGPWLLKWTTETPSAAGWYFHRPCGFDTGSAKYEIIRIDIGGTAVPYGPRGSLIPGDEWAGPIPVPVERRGK